MKKNLLIKDNSVAHLEHPPIYEEDTREGISRGALDDSTQHQSKVADNSLIRLPNLYAESMLTSPLTTGSSKQIPFATKNSAMAQLNMLSDNSFLSLGLENNDQNVLREMIQKKMMSTTTHKMTNIQKALHQV